VHKRISFLQTWCCVPITGRIFNQQYHNYSFNLKKLESNVCLFPTVHNRIDSQISQTLKTDLVIHSATWNIKQKAKCNSNLWTFKWILVKITLTSSLSKFPNLSCTKISVSIL